MAPYEPGINLDEMDMGDEPIKTQDEPSRARGGTGPEWASRFKFIVERGLDIDTDPGEPPAIIACQDGGCFIQEGEYLMLAAAGGCGKTHVDSSLAVAVASGANWLGPDPVGFKVKKEGRVLLMLAEESDRSIRRLIYKSAKNMKLNSAQREKLKRRLLAIGMQGVDCSMLDRFNKQTAFYDDLLANLKSALPSDDKEGWRLLIFDPVARFAGPEAEKDNTAAHDFSRLMEYLTRNAPGHPAVMVAHHVSKQSTNEREDDGFLNQNAARGSSGLVNGARTLITMASPKRDKKEISDLVGFHHAKVNGVRKINNLYLTRGSDGYLSIGAEEEIGRLFAEAGIKSDKQGTGKRNAKDKPEPEGPTDD